MLLLYRYGTEHLIPSLTCRAHYLLAQSTTAVYDIAKILVNSDPHTLLVMIINTYNNTHKTANITTTRTRTTTTNYYYYCASSNAGTSARLARHVEANLNPNPTPTPNPNSVARPPTLPRYHSKHPVVTVRNACGLTLMRVDCWGVGVG
jgi:hypothetical protein